MIEKTKLNKTINTVNKMREQQNQKLAFAKNTQTDKLKYLSKTDKKIVTKKKEVIIKL